MIKCKLQSFVHFEHPPLDYVLPQSHSTYEIVFYANGKGMTNINSELYHYDDMDFVIIEPNTIHDEKSSVTTEVYCVLFDLEGISLKNKFYQKDELLAPTIYNYMKQIKELYISQDLYYEEYISSLILQMIIHIIRDEEKDNNYSNYNERIASVIRLSKKLLKEHVYMNSDLSIVAENVGYSYDHFRHLFKDYVGMSPKQYQIEQKMNRAKHLLLNTNLKIKEIATQCGFSSGIAFNDFFKKRLNLTPLEFRQLGESQIDKVLLKK